MTISQPLVFSASSKERLRKGLVCRKEKKVGEGEKGGKAYNDESTRSLGSHCVLRIFIRERQIPVRAREAAEGADEREEDEEEGDVCAEGADEKDEADESCECTFVLAFFRSIGALVRKTMGMRRTHEDEEEGKASVKPRRLQAQRIPRIPVLPGHLCGIGDIGAVCVEGRDEGAAKGEPEGA